VRRTFEAAGRRLRAAALGLGLAACGAAPAAAAGLDAALYGALLEAHTTPTDGVAGVLVDYTEVRRDPRWSTLLGQVAAQDLEGASRAQRLAFWINAYNILAIDLVARHFPLESIRDIGSFFRPVWDRPAGTAAGAERTLGGIEHEILREMGEPRIHAAIVCASTSCPPLARTPFTAEELDAQLDAAVRTWLASERKGVRIDRAGREVTLSPIFDWFEEDFEPAGGVLGFVARHLPADEAAWLRAERDRISVEHFDYDWSVNHGSRPTPRKAPAARDPDA